MLLQFVYDNQRHVKLLNQLSDFETLIRFIKSIFQKLPPNFILTYLDSDQDNISLFNNSDLQVLRETDLKKVRIEIVDNSEDFFDLSQEINMKENLKEMQDNLFEVEVEELVEKEEKLEEEEKFEVLMKDKRLSEISEIKSLDSSLKVDKYFSQINSELMKDSQIKRENGELMMHASKIEESNYVHNISCDGCGISPLTRIRYKCSVCEEYNLCENCEFSSEHQHPFLKIKNIFASKFLQKNQEVAEKVQRVDQQKNRNQKCPFSKIMMKMDRGIKKAEKYFNKFTESFCEFATDLSINKEEEQRQKETEVDVEKESRLIENASYLNDTINICFEKGLKYASLYPSLGKEELLNKYINERE